MIRETHYKVVIADFAHGAEKVLHELGFGIDVRREILVMTMTQILEHIKLFLTKDLSVMIRPRNQETQWDYIIYVDTKQGRFMTR